MPPTMLSVGLDPTLIASRPGPGALEGLDHDTVLAGAARAYDDLRALGFGIDRCLLDLGTTAETAYRHALTGATYDYVCIGSGIRLDPALTHLFEMLVDVTRELAPGATLVFDTGPTTKADAVRRWFPVRRPLETDPYREVP